MKQTYRVLASLVALFVVLQAMAIALGGFGVIHDVDNGLVVDKNFQPNFGQTLHGIDGMYVIPLLGLALLIVSFFAAKSVPGARKWGAIVFGLIVLQVALAFIAFGVPAIGALHGINAMAILGTSVRASMLTRQSAVAGSAASGSFAVPQQSTGPSTPEASRPVN